MTLSPKAQQVINEYFNLPFSGVDGVRCPYFNNARLARRGQLRALIGKGSPKEIAEEAKIISIQYKHNIFDHDGQCCLHGENQINDKAKCIRQFLVDNNLGIDCSGFATHVLRAHFLETKKIDFVKKMNITSSKNILRKIIARMRPVEQMDVKAYAREDNSKLVDFKDAQAGDVIIMMEITPRTNRNHILIIEDKTDKEIKYVSARAWPSEGKYGHGVARGVIHLINPSANLLEQKWAENNQTKEANGTFQEAKNAKILQIRRLKI